MFYFVTNKQNIKYGNDDRVNVIEKDDNNEDNNNINNRGTKTG